MLDTRVHSSYQQAEISRLFVSKFLSGPYYTDLPNANYEWHRVIVFITSGEEVMFSSLFVCLSVSNLAQKLPNGFA